MYSGVFLRIELGTWDSERTKQESSAGDLGEYILLGDRGSCESDLGAESGISLIESTRLRFFPASGCSSRDSS